MEDCTDFFKALALQPGDPLASDLLLRALSESAAQPLSTGSADEEIARSIDDLLLQAGQVSMSATESDAAEEGEEEDMEYD